VSWWSKVKVLNKPLQKNKYQFILVPLYYIMNKTFATPQEGLRDTVTLNNGVRMPRLGLGVFQVKDGDQVKEAVLNALETGYRCIDTAAIYGNEKGVGEAIRASGIGRDELFITTKLWNDDIRQRNLQGAFDASLERLGLDYLDLYLIHWPVENRYEAWDFLTDLQEKKCVRAIGVSNFMISHLEELLAVSQTIPAINQVEYHPYLQSRPLHNYCLGKGIRLQAWSPLMQGKVLKDEVIQNIAAKYGKTPAQIVLRWELQMGVLVIPKSVHLERIRENCDVFDFDLSEDEMYLICDLERDQRNGADPMNFNF